MRILSLYHGSELILFSMKRTALSLIILLLGLSCTHAQSYRSVFGQQQTSWNIKTTDMPGDFVDSLVVTGDTLIEGVLHRSLAYYQIWEGTAFLEDSFVSFLREDTTSGHLWYVSADGDTMLIQDMSLSEADSFRVHTVGGTFEGEYSLVSNIYFDTDGRKVIELELITGMGQPYTMIEGVGPNVGIKYMLGPTVQNTNCPVLLCHYIDEDANYVNNHPVYSGQCNLIPTDIDESIPIRPIGWNIFPNPAMQGHLVTITSSDPIKHIILVDAWGRTVMDILPSGNKLEYHLSELPCGFYLLQTNDRDIRKLIIN
jgi:hypothetical protein